MNVSEVFEKMVTEKYYSGKELKYDTKPGLFLQAYEYNKLLDYIDGYNGVDCVVEHLDLLPITKGQLRFTRCAELNSLLDDYLDIAYEDFKTTNSFVVFRNIDAITKSRIFSEIEGTLNIENVPTTRKLLDDIICKNKKPETNNEQMIHNMAVAIEFVNTSPEFNEENLFKLYSILSKNCLDDEDKIVPGNLYRHGEVEIDNYDGCPSGLIKTRMDSLFLFVNNNLNNKEIKFFLPHIAHYYVLYIHPYFDFNGRAARMVSYWISILSNNHVFPPVISEAINQSKNDYYVSLRETRNSRNDITYFLIYITRVSIQYFLTYKNIEYIEDCLRNKSVTLSETDKTYMKKILISSKGRFLYEDFVKWSNTNMSKQAALKILNGFDEIGFLNSEISKSNRKFFEIEPSMVKYVFKTE